MIINNDTRNGGTAGVDIWGALHHLERKFERPDERKFRP